MSIAEGFQAGFNLALKAKSLKNEEEERKRKAGIEEQKLEMEEELFDFRKKELESSRIRNEAMSASYDANAMLNQARANQLISDQNLKELTAENSEKARGYRSIGSMITQLESLPDDVNAREEVFYGIAGQANFIKQQTGLDFFEMVDPKTFAAFGEIQPIIESGDFSRFGPAQKDALNQIYQHNLNLFRGKNFVTNEGQSGTIDKVNLTGNFIAADDGKAMLVEGEYVVNLNGEQKTFVGLLPDLQTQEISEGIEPTDAKAVSIAEAVDFMSALRTVSSRFVQNPQSAEFAKSAIKFKLDFLDPETEEEKKRDNVTIRQIFETQMENFLDAKAIAVESGIDLSLPASEQPEAVDATIRRFAYDFPNLDTEQKDGLYIIPEAYKGNLGKYFASVQPQYEKTVEMVTSSTKFNIDPKDLKPNQKAVYSFGNEIIPFNEDRGEFIETLRGLYQTDEIDTLVQQADSIGLNDEQLLDYLYMQLTQKPR